MGNCISIEPSYCHICLYYFNFYMSLACDNCNKKFHFKCVMCFDEHLSKCPNCHHSLKIKYLKI